MFRFALFVFLQIVPTVCFARDDGFFIRPLNEDLKRKITGVSYPANEPAEISYDDLADIHVRHYGFDGQTHDGRLICNRKIAFEILAVFQELFNARYPVEKIRLIEEYNGDDNASMKDNNTSCFNYRKIAGTNKLSNHSYGLAADINPLYNPYVKTKKNQTIVSPLEATPYVDRTKDFAHKIDHDDAAYRAFARQGFIWGGDWSSPKDYQHFEYKPAQSPRR